MLLPGVTMLLLGIGEPIAEQRVYVAGCGFAMAVGMIFGRLRKWPRSSWMPARLLAVVALGVLLVGLASRTIARNEVWSDPVRLWSEAVSHSPDYWLPYRGLGDALRARGDCGRAIDAYQMAVRLKPDEAATYAPLGICFLLTGQFKEGQNAFDSAARLAPALVTVEPRLGDAARLPVSIDAVRDCLLEVARLHPDAVLPRQYLAELYERGYSDSVSALRVCREIAALGPNTPGVAECIRRNGQAVTKLDSQSR
jgi:tetratricopeptide (TPR) repeat protein